LLPESECIDNPRPRQGKYLPVPGVELLPGKISIPGPATEPMLPGLFNVSVHQFHCFVVSSDAEISVVTLEFRLQTTVLLGNTPVSVVTAPGPDSFVSPIQASTPRPSLDCPSSSPRLPPVMGETEKVECPGTFGLFSGWSTELDKPALGRMDGQTEPSEPFGQHRKDALCIVAQRTTDDKIINESHYETPSPQTGLHILRYPFVQHVVQVDIGQNRGDDSPLGGAGFGPLNAALVQNTRVQPLADLPQQGSVVHLPFEEGA